MFQNKIHITKNCLKRNMRKTIPTILAECQTDLHYRKIIFPCALWSIKSTTPIKIKHKILLETKLTKRHSLLDPMITI